ncbi:metal-sensitive transcriptional regulator [Paenibacillus popilliae]|nr:metal-sensitive transcriptional regulator [Paenibacillus sp. SDF0028]
MSNERIDEQVDDVMTAAFGTEDACHASEERCEHHTPDGERKSHHSDEMKKKLVHRLNRIEGQVRGVKSMIEKDTYCDDVLNQIASIQSALHSVGKLLLEGHMKSCVVERLQDGEPEVIDELLTTIHKLLK